MALIVVKKEIIWSVRKIGQPTRDPTLPFSPLVRIGKGDLSPAPEPRRMCHHFQPADSPLFNRERKENIGISQSVMIEQVSRSGVEVVGIDRPAP